LTFGEKKTVTNFVRRGGGRIKGRKKKLLIFGEKRAGADHSGEAVGRVRAGCREEGVLSERTALEKRKRNIVRIARKSVINVF